MVSIADLLSLEAALVSVHSPLVSGPARPAGATYVTDRLAAIGLSAPDGLLEWFGWRNGDDGPLEPIQRPSSNLIIGRMVALTVEQAIEMRRMLFDLLGDADSFAFDAHWLPIMIGHSSSGAVCVDCRDQPGSIVLFDTQLQQPDAPDSRICGSIHELAGLYVTAIENGWVDLDDTSPQFLDFVLDRVPREQWDPLLSL